MSPSSVLHIFRIALAPPPPNLFLHQHITSASVTSPNSSILHPHPVSVASHLPRVVRRRDRGSFALAACRLFLKRILKSLSSTFHHGIQRRLTFHTASAKSRYQHSDLFKGLHCTPSEITSSLPWGPCTRTSPLKRSRCWTLSFHLTSYPIELLQAR